MDLLLGLSTKNYLKLCKENNYSIEAKYIPRFFLGFVKSVMNTRFNNKETKEIKGIYENSKIDDPIFIIGHWRSGTTFLHNLLINDPQFAYPNIFEIMNPGSFLHREDKELEQLKNMESRKRPMDNIEINIDSPGEDEFAISALSLISPLFAWVFPKKSEKFNKYLTLENCSVEEVKIWKDSFTLFLKKLSFRYNKKLLLKSPTHLGKIANILNLFPNAKFIHIYRDQEKVFQSTKKLLNEIVPKTCFQSLENEKIDNSILTNYKALYDSYFKNRDKIKKGNLVEINYSDLVGDKINSIKKIYSELDINYSDQFHSALSKYVDSQKNYVTNKYVPLDEDTSKLLKSEIGYIWENLMNKEV